MKFIVIIIGFILILTLLHNTWAAIPLNEQTLNEIIKQSDELDKKYHIDVGRYRHSLSVYNEGSYGEGGNS